MEKDINEYWVLQTDFNTGWIDTVYVAKEEADAFAMLNEARDNATILHSTSKFRLAHITKTIVEE